MTSARFSATSSTTSTFCAARDSRSRRARRGASSGVGVAPPAPQLEPEARCRSPGSLSTSMSPPIERTSWRLIARPSPVPPMRRARVAHLLEGLEEARQICRPRCRCRCLAPRSAAGRRRSPARAAHVQTHLAAVGELHRVAQQVQQHLPQPLLVGAHGLRQAARGIEAEQQVLLLGLHAHRCRR